MSSQFGQIPPRVFGAFLRPFTVRAAMFAPLDARMKQLFVNSLAHPHLNCTCSVVGAALVLFLRLLRQPRKRFSEEHLSSECVSECFPPSRTLLLAAGYKMWQQYNPERGVFGDDATVSLHGFVCCLPRRVLSISKCVPTKHLV